MIPTMSETGTKWAIRSRSVVTPAQARPATVVIDGEQIAAVMPYEFAQPGLSVIDVGDHWIMPGLVDSHVHINEPGRTGGKASRPPRRRGRRRYHHAHRHAAEFEPGDDDGRSLAFETGRGRRQDQRRLRFSWRRDPAPRQAHSAADRCRRLAAFKAFLCPSGIDEFPPVTEADLRQVMPILADARISSSCTPN